MKKGLYKMPQMWVVQLEQEDVICTSPGDNDTPFEPTAVIESTGRLDPEKQWWTGYY